MGRGIGLGVVCRRGSELDDLRSGILVLFCYLFSVRVYDFGRSWDFGDNSFLFLRERKFGFL